MSLDIFFGVWHSFTPMKLFIAKSRLEISSYFWDLVLQQGLSSIWIGHAAVLLLQQKSWWYERELMARDPTEDVGVGIRGLSWLS